MISKALAGGCFAAVVAGSSTSASAAPAVRPLQIADAVIAQEFQIQGAPAAFSPDGRWISATVCDPTKVKMGEDDDGNIATKGAAYRSMGCDIWLYPAASTDAARNLTKNSGNNWSPSWSPDGKSIAFYSDRDGQPGLWLWQQSGDSFRKVTAAPTRHRLAFETPIWTPDGKALIVKLRPEGVTEEPRDTAANSQAMVVDKEPGSTLTLFRSPRPEQKTTTPKEAPVDPMQTDIAWVNVADGTVRRLLNGLVSMTQQLSPDGKWLLVTAYIPNDPDFATSIHLIEVASGKLQAKVDKVVQSFSGAVSWSPDSRHWAYVAIDLAAREAQQAAATTTSVSPPDGGDLYIATVDGSATLKVTGAPSNFFDADHLPPLWSPQGDFFYSRTEEGQVWKVDAASGRGQALTKDTVRMIRTLVSSPAKNVLGASDGSVIYASIRNKQNRKHGFIKIDTTTGQITTVQEEDKVYQSTFNAPVTSADGKQIVYLAESSADSGDLWIADMGFRKARRLSIINPQLAQYKFGRGQVIEFKNNDGKTLQASILLPADYQVGKRYPTVLWVYASQDDSERYANSFGLVPMQAFNMHMFTTRGYAVMWPSIPTNKATPVKDLMKSVMPAIDRLVDLGIADPDRLAVMGNSNGGYSTLALITQTQRFKAAVMNAGFGDLTAFYGTMGGGWIPWLESKGGSMGVPPWEDPVRYIENSPVYYLDQVQTPLIIQAGAADSGIIQHSDQVWVGLQRLNKDVTYLRYGGEGHVLAGAANLKDYWQRVIAFFEQHL